MSLSASDIHSLYRPSPCELRVFLRAHNEPEAEPSEYDRLLQELGRQHEQKHFASFEKILDLSEGSLDERAERTRKAVESGIQVIYQGVLQATLPGSAEVVIGIPDFLIREGQSYRIRDCKLSRHADENRHFEIVLQLQLYGWLLESSLGKSTSGLDAYLGDEEITEIPPPTGNYLLEILEKLRMLKAQEEEPYSPVGWTKCGACGFQSRCWRMATDTQDVATVFELDQSTAIALRNHGVHTIKELLAKFTEASLSELKKQRGDSMVRVGKASSRILLQAQSMISGEERLISPLQLPSEENLVMFDLEGLPPQFEDLDKVYLWGMQVFGKKPGLYAPALATFGSDGDKRGWEDFLAAARSIFETYRDIPFIHWASYETTKIKGYVKRHGDIDGVAERVIRNCVDLLKITRQSLVLPDYSYSLKVIEKRVGFKRTMDEYGGDWSIAQYIRAVESQDEKLRQGIMSQILKYNEEDLQATWAVFQWLKSKNQ